MVLPPNWNLYSYSIVPRRKVIFSKPLIFSNKAQALFEGSFILGIIAQFKVPIEYELTLIGYLMVRDLMIGLEYSNPRK